MSTSRFRLKHGGGMTSTERLDNAWNLKFAHPALFTGTDLLRLVVEASPSEGRERRQNAIRAFLSDQFEYDREVKFKQAELENDLFDLFTDVPLLPWKDPFEGKHREVELLLASFSRVATSASGSVDSDGVDRWLEMVWGRASGFGGYYPRDEVWLGTASLLLDRDFQQAEPFVILEGAPGQGKSTIAQYICQVHRIRMLAHKGSGTVDNGHLNSPLRLPFKVELRDFATWLSGSNPFGTVTGGDSQHASSQIARGVFIGAGALRVRWIRLRRLGPAGDARFVTCAHCP